MKKHLKIFLATVIVTGIIAGCKKDKIAAVKDYVSSVKDKTWWGEFTYTGKPVEYYCVHFNNDNTLLWSQFSGDYTGKWVINGKELTMIFDVSKAEIKANISADDKLLDITDNTGSFEMNTGQLSADPNISLDNTVWDGKPFTTNLYSLAISFVPISKVDIQETYFYPPSLYKSYFYLNNTYTRPASGGVIRADIKPAGNGAGSLFFGVIISGTEMKGSYINSNIQWQATKQ